MNRKIVIVSIFSLLFLQGCDCMQYEKGIVIDLETKQPISGVIVHKQGKENDRSITNDNGEFEITSISGGLFRCPSMKIIIEKDGYETIQQKGGGKIELRKK